MTAKFDFIQSYRDLDGSASREVVEARQKSFEKLSRGDRGDGCRSTISAASHIRSKPLSALSWFEDGVREFDPHFVASKDKVDAGRMAALLLRQWMTVIGIRYARWRSLRRRTAAEGIPPTATF